VQFVQWRQKFREAVGFSEYYTAYQTARCHYSTDHNLRIYPIVLHVHVYIPMLWTSNSMWKFRKSSQLTGTEQTSMYWPDPPGYDMTKREFNVYWSLRRLLRVSFSLYPACVLLRSNRFKISSTSDMVSFSKIVHATSVSRFLGVEIV